MRNNRSPPRLHNLLILQILLLHQAIGHRKQIIILKLRYPLLDLLLLLLGLLLLLHRIHLIILLILHPCLQFLQRRFLKITLVQLTGLIAHLHRESYICALSFFAFEEDFAT